MKKTLTFFLALFACVTYAQQRGNVVINWTDQQQAVFGERKINIPQFSAENLEYNATKKEIQYKIRIPLTARIDENSLQITDVVYESMTAAQLGELSANALPTKITAKI